MKKYNRFLILSISSILIFFILSSCSSQYHLRKAIKKDPSIVQMDTILTTIHDTTITETIRVDSIFLISKDTVIIIKDKLTIKHFIHNDTVHIWAECEGDTLIKEIIVETIVERWIYPKKRWFEYLPPVWVWLLAAAILIWRRYFRKGNPHLGNNQPVS